MSYIVPWLFIIFYVIVLFFLHTYPYKHVHMLFFKLPHSFDVSHCFIIIIWDESGITNESWSSVFISTGEKKEAWCVSTVHFSLALCCPLCTLKCLLFQSFICCGSSVLKALPTCLYVGQPRWLGPPRSLQWQFLYRSVGLDSISSQVWGT